MRRIISPRPRLADSSPSSNIHTSTSNHVFRPNHTHSFRILRTLASPESSADLDDSSRHACNKECIIPASLAFRSGVLGQFHTDGTNTGVLTRRLGYGVLLAWIGVSYFVPVLEYWNISKYSWIILVYTLISAVRNPKFDFEMLSERLIKTLLFLLFSCFLVVYLCKIT